MSSLKGTGNPSLGVTVRSDLVIHGDWEVSGFTAEVTSHVMAPDQS